MLVDVDLRIVSDELKQKITEACGEYIDLTPVHIRKGMYYSDLNFQCMVDSKIDDYPEFSRRNTKWLNQLFSNPNFGDDLSYRKRLYDHEMKKPLKTYENKRKFKKLYRKSYGSIHGFNNYGVVDFPEQILKFYDFEKDPRKFAIFFTPIYKEDQSEWGGWRWEKWGPYLGSQKVTSDYLYYEKHIDMIMVYHVVEVLD